MQRPVVLHVMTQKGRGYQPAEEHPKLFHGIGEFDPATGEPLKKSGTTFSESFGEVLCKIAAVNSRVCAITAAMPGGTGLLGFKSAYPKRLFDVGIAEEHAVSMAGGLAKQGMIPVVALYSTFLQRSYDMILQDVCMLGLHVVFAIDRAGLVGEDGETHHGIYDVGFLRHAPGLTVLCPASCAEQQAMLRWAIQEQSGPVAIRYPRGGDRSYQDSAWNADNSGVFCHRSGSDVTLITYGTVLQNAMEVAEILESNGLNAAVLRLLRVNPLPVDEILRQTATASRVVIVEEVSANCGICDTLAFQITAKNPYCRVDCINLGNAYVQHGSVDKLYEHYGLSARKIADSILEVHQSEN